MPRLGGNRFAEPYLEPRMYKSDVLPLRKKREIELITQKYIAKIVIQFALEMYRVPRVTADGSGENMHQALM